MSLDKTLDDLFVGLLSDRVTERRKNGELLRELLAGAGTPHLLSQNHRNGSGLSWKDFLFKIHELILKESEKFDSGRTSAHDNVKSQCSSLLISVISGANKNNCYINCDRILDICAEILKSPRLQKAFGEAYITLLNKHVLPVQHYLENLSPYQWADLLELGTELCTSSAIDRSISVRMVMEVIKNGSPRCHLILPIRDSLTSITALFASDNNDRQHHLQENLLKIAILAIDNIASESRLAICAFTETIIPSAMKFYDQTSDAFKNKKKLLFRLLYLAVTTHHPGGRIGKEPGCLAKDWTAWSACLVAIEQLVMGEALFLKHSLKRNIHLSHTQHELCPEFLALSVEIYHLLFKGFTPDQLESNCEQENPPKRCRMERSEIRSMQQLLIHIPDNFYPWLSILGSYMNKYGSTVSHSDQLEILRVLGLLAVSEKSDPMCLSALKTISAFLNVIKSIGWNDIFFEAAEKIWKTCVRKVSTSSVVFDECHTVIQILLQISGFSGPINALIKLYSEKTMPHSYESLFTLTLILSKYNNTITDIIARIQISNWAFVAFKNSYAQDIVAFVLFQICVIENVEASMKEVETNKTFLENLFDCHETIILISDFESGLLVENKLEEKLKVIEKQSLTIWDKPCQHVIEFLNLTMKTNEIKNCSELSPIIITECDIILRYISYFINFNIIESVSGISALKCTAYETFDMIAAYLPGHLNNLPRASNIKHIMLKNIKSLFITDHYSSDVSLTIREKTTKQLVESLCLLANDSESMQVDGFDFMEMNNSCVVTENHVKMVAVDILANYSIPESNFSSDALQYILSPDLYDFQIKNEFDIAVNAVSSILSRDKNDAPIGFILRLMQEMCRKLFRNCDATSQILTLLYDVLEPVVHSGNTVLRENCLIILRSYLQRCKTHYYTPKVMGQVFRCALWIHCRSDEINYGGELDNTFTEGLSSSLHSIRLYSCYCIGHVMKNTALEQYEALIEVLLEMFKVDAADLTEDVIADEGVNRTSTIFHCLSSVAVSSPVWDKRSLFTILNIAHKKNISGRLLKNVFQHISDYLKISSVKKLISDNIDELISSWLKNELPLDKFPYSLAECDSIEVFYSIYKETIIPMDMFWSNSGKMSPVLAQVSRTINQSGLDIMTSCLPQLFTTCLPFVAIDNKRGLNGVILERTEINSGKNLHVTISNQLGDSMKSLIIQDIVKIIFLTLKRVCDSQQIKKDLGWNGPLPHGMQLNKTDYNNIINHLNETFEEDVIFHICLNNPSGIQELLQLLWAEIKSQTTLERKLTSLHQYWIFCHSVPQQCSVNAFACSFIIGSMLHLISTYHNDKEYSYMSVAACRMLLSIIQRIMKEDMEYSHIISPHFSFIIYTISQTVSAEATGIKEFALKILNFLLIEMKPQFDDVMKTLDPLPNIDCFKNINKNLETVLPKSSESLYVYIDNFLKGGLLGRFEGLKLLYQKLKSSKEELATLFEKLKESQGFSEDCENSILHRLASSLLHIASNKNDQESSLQACRCLGELGVSDFQTIVLQPPSTPSLIIDKNPIEYLAYLALREIKDLVFDSDPKVIAAASEALSSLLLFKEGFIALEILVSEEGKRVKDMLVPFMSQKKTFSTTKVKIASQAFERFSENCNLWFISAEKGHSIWVVELTMAIVDIFATQNCFLHNLSGVCKLKPSLAQKLLPPLVGLIHLSNNKNHVTTIRSQVKKFFQRYYETTFISSSRNDALATQTIPENVEIASEEESRAKANEKIEMESVRCMLELVEFIILQKSHYSLKDKLWTNAENDSLDYLTIAWAACATGSHFAAIYYGELWCSSQLHETPPSNPDKISALPRGENMLSILRKSYLAIGDTDAINGCGSAHLLDPAERRNHYMRNGSFTDALLMHDLLSAREKNIIPMTVDREDEGITSSYNSTSSTSSVMDPNVISERSFAQSLQMSHFYHLAGKYMDACGPSRMVDDIKYETFWRLGDWSLLGNTSCLKTKLSKNSSVNDNLDISKLNNYWPGYQYVCLKKALTENIQRNVASLQESLKDAREYLTFSFIENGIESCQSFYELTTKLETLQEIEYYAEIHSTNKNEGPLNYFDNLFMSWSVNNILPFNNFKHVEPILAQRIVILKHLSNKTEDMQSKIFCAELQLDYAELALSNDCIQVGTRWIDSASCTADALFKCHRSKTQPLLDGVAKLVGLVRLAEGIAAWKGGHSDVALHLVKNLITNGNNIDNVLYANALRQYGSWMVETRSESALDIVNNYLKRSLDLLGVERSINASVDAYLSIARFTDEEYKQVDSYIKSASFVNKVKCMERCKVRADGLKEMKQIKNLSNDERKALFFNDGQSNIDEVEINNTQAEREQYLQLAIRYYLCTLCNSEEHNLCVFRVISLWLNNTTLELNGESEKTLAEYLNTIPSRKFLPLIPQLTPRMSKKNGDPFQEKLYKLIERCVIDHPHHTLPVLLAITNSNKDKEILSKASSQFTANDTNNSPEEPYVIVARKMVQALSKSGNARLTNIIKQTELVSLAMISLANLKLKPGKTQQAIPRSEPLRNIKQQPHALVPTVTLPVKYDTDYHHIPSVVSFSDNFELVGGVNLPKKLFCRGSDGINRPMLLKGEDDIRQDAVMQQVFVIVNHLLSRNQHTRHRRLIIRTYKVVALSRRSGVIEWCDGTDSLGRLLIGPDGSKGYHAKIRPNDMPSKTARELMTSKRTSTNDEKLNVFKKILAQFKPVFHHFFIENFLMPAIWYERKLAYTHSVATSSMIGYILGLGDRHVQNILIDTSTAEVVHIDLGIAFEQGRVQPTPETVPFRLTQDMVSGFGAAGVEGVFRRSCEKTMDVLKKNQETLLTILEVLLCDPLYMWTVSPQKAYEKQNGSVPSIATLSVTISQTTGAQSSGSEAERALLRVQNKLEGSEFGCALATPGQVSRLIQQATDINNLSRLFAGWQPYL